MEGNFSLFKSCRQLGKMADSHHKDHLSISGQAGAFMSREKGGRTKKLEGVAGSPLRATGCHVRVSIVSLDDHVGA